MDEFFDEKDVYYNFDSYVSFNYQCGHCNAILFDNEPNGFCCKNGEIKIQRFEIPPDSIKGLLTGDNENSLIFKQFSMALNNLFCFSRWTHNRETDRGPTLVISGKASQYLKKAVISDVYEETNNQLYLFDSDDQFFC